MIKGVLHAATAGGSCLSARHPLFREPLSRSASSPDTRTVHPGGRAAGATAWMGCMFVFLSNRTGCLGSLLISLVGTAVLFLVLYSCQRI